jgi:single-strand DNA-binding protein
MSWQNFTAVGNLGDAAELRYTKGKNTAVASFRMAVNEKWGDNEKTTWFRVSVWGKQAEAIAKYLTKGKQVLVSGTIDVSVYKDKRGDPAATMEVNAREVRLLGGGERTAQKQDEDDWGKGGGGQFDDDPLPF